MIALGREVVRRFSQDEGFLLASALSFGVVLCLAPFTLIFFSVAGFLLSSREIADYVSDSATDFEPYLEIGDWARLGCGEGTYDPKCWGEVRDARMLYAFRGKGSGQGAGATRLNPRHPENMLPPVAHPCLHAPHP